MSNKIWHSAKYDPPKLGSYNHRESLVFWYILKTGVVLQLIVFTTCIPMSIIGWTPKLVCVR